MAIFLYYIFQVILKVDYVIILINLHIPSFFILVTHIHVCFQQVELYSILLSIWLTIFCFQFLISQVLFNNSLHSDLAIFISIINHSFLFSIILMSFISKPMIQINPSNTSYYLFCNSLPLNFLYHSNIMVYKVT